MANNNLWMNLIGSYNSQLSIIREIGREDGEAIESTTLSFGCCPTCHQHLRD